MYSFRTYQEEAVEKGVNFLTGKSTGGAILVLPTGSGKSLVIAGIANRLPGKILVLQPSKEILEQNLEKLHSFGFTDTGVFSASCGRKDIGHVTFATIGSVIRKQELFADVEHVIIDECHGVNAKGGMYEKFLKFLGKHPLGLTASPFRLHSFEDFKTGERAVVAQLLTRTRPRIFSKVLHITQMKEMFSGGFLCPVEYVLNEGYDHGKIKLNSTGMDFNKEALKAYNEKANVVGVVRESIESLKAEHVLVFCVFVEEANILAEQLRDVGLSAVSISAETPAREREQILRDFRSGAIQVVTNVGVLTTGFDFPELDCVVLARPTQSVALYYQMVGRGVRTAPGKLAYKLVDICGNVKRFGRIEDFEFVETETGLRLKSGTSFLTGFDFVGNEDLEARDYKGKRETTGENNDKIWRIGKHKGLHITRVPTGYLEWVVENFSDGAWKVKAEREIARRTMNDERRLESAADAF